MFAVIVNTLTVLIGSAVGLFLKKGIPQKLADAVMLGIGLCTLYIGIDGTLKSFACDTPLQGRAAMKTGSMRNVQNMAGYLLDDEGMPTHVVVVFVNGFFCKRADLRTAIADYLTQFLQNQ